MVDSFYRMEGPDGRGPFRPRWSKTWRDANGPDLAPPWVEAGINVDAFIRLIPEGCAVVCGCRTLAQLHKWFSRSERRRLKRLGYRQVEVPAAEIILETPTQVVFVRAA